LNRRATIVRLSHSLLFSAKMFFLLALSLVLQVSVIKCRVTDWLLTRESETLRTLQTDILALRILILLTSGALVSLKSSCITEPACSCNPTISSVEFD